MDYVKGIFKNRPNRFIAEVEVDGSLEIAHVPNTGRCRELLVDDAVVWLKPSDNPKRKTKFSLHFVENKGVLVSLFSQQANSIVYDAIVNGKIKELSGYSYHAREKTVDDSRIDIYLANEDGSYSHETIPYTEFRNAGKVIGCDAVLSFFDDGTIIITDKRCCESDGGEHLVTLTGLNGEVEWFNVANNAWEDISTCEMAMVDENGLMVGLTTASQLIVRAK